jgi:hypothetical protein
VLEICRLVCNLPLYKIPYTYVGGGLNENSETEKKVARKYEILLVRKNYCFGGIFCGAHYRKISHQNNKFTLQ